MHHNPTPYTYTQVKSIATSVPRPRPPSLIPPPTIKRRLPKLDINLIMRPAHPLTQALPTLNLGRILGNVPLEILRADPARVELREEPHEGDHVVLLRPVGCFGIAGRYAV